MPIPLPVKAASESRCFFRLLIQGILQWTDVSFENSPSTSVGHYYLHYADQRIENMGYLASCLTIKSLQQPVVQVSNGYLENPMFLERSGRRYSISLRQSSIASHRGLHSSIIDDEEWQRERQRETEELRKRREIEDQEEKEKTENYRSMSKRLEGYDEEEVKEAKAIVASFIRAGEEVEERINEAADEGKLTKLVLLTIQNRMELARHDDERHVIQALDLLFRRIEAEMMRRQATPAMRFLDELLNLHDGSSHDEWIRRCRQAMIKTFPSEDAFTILAPHGVDLQFHHGPIDMPDNDILLRVDFIEEVDAFLAEIVQAHSKVEIADGLDPQSVAIRISQQQKEDAIQQVKDLLKLAIDLKW